MPLASWFSLHYSGPGTAAMVTQGQGEVVAGIGGIAQPDSVINGAGSMPLAKPTRLVNSPMVTTGAGAIVQALPKARARPACIIRVNELSQDDVTGAVLESPIEDGVTLREALRLLLAIAAGKTTITPGVGDTAVVTFRDVNDTVTRVSAAMDGSERTGVTLDTN